MPCGAPAMTFKVAPLMSFDETIAVIPVRAARTDTCKGGLPAARLNRALDFMRQNCARVTRLWELAQVAGMSPHYFCESFKQSTGLSPYRYAFQQRATQAKECL